MDFIIVHAIVDQVEEECCPAPAFWPWLSQCVAYETSKELPAFEMGAQGPPTVSPLTDVSEPYSPLHNSP